MKNTNIHGLKDRLRAAESEYEIQQLLREGEGYDGASDETRHEWQVRAKKRREQLAQSEIGHSADTAE